MILLCKQSTETPVSSYVKYFLNLVTLIVQHAKSLLQTLKTEKVLSINIAINVLADKYRNASSKFHRFPIPASATDA